ncbi:unnamed protein product [Strongylus vulgaris]|uniref:Uncharacterized protein n=1 Tax=Strongylus vulgaris TaxID=40348 RepID=A0A3P7IF46_STRVU|nr:unnamed protein product [Strongylus vulgaris]
MNHRYFAVTSCVRTRSWRGCEYCKVLIDTQHKVQNNYREILNIIVREGKELQAIYNLQSQMYQLCSSCRAVRHLPNSYFPRVLNEIICGESSCIRGDGRCAQKFLPLKVSDNES